MSEPPLGSLERFRKRSTRLVLEEYDLAVTEPSAGCGGIVLRWRNPQRTVPLVVYLDSPGESHLFLDGVLVESNGVDLAPGAHQLALALDDIDLSGALFLFVALQETEDYRNAAWGGLAESPWRLMSQADQTWLATLEEPVTGDWKGTEFDDASWIALTRFVPGPPANWSYSGWLGLTRDELLSGFLALLHGKGRRGRVWVRKRFVVGGPQTS
jgi:hypothetical protein